MSVLLDPSVLDRLDIPRSRRVNGVGSGNRVSRRTGAGTEILSARPYNYGDDYRQVDWNASARTGELHVKQRIADTDTPVRLVLDAGAGMRFGTAGRKWDAARTAVQVLAAVSARAQEPASIVVAGDSTAILPVPRRQAGASFLEKALDSAPQWGTPSGLGKALMSLHLPQASPSAVVVLSGMYLSDDELNALTGVAVRHSVAYVEVVDPAELRLSDVGRLRVQDPETGNVLTVNTSRASVRQEYAERVDSLRGHIGQVLARQGIPRLTLSTGQDPLRQMLAQLPRRRA